MTRTRYVLAVCLMLSAAAFVAACGGSDKTNTASGKAGSSTSAPSGNKKVSIVAAVQVPTQATEMCAAKSVLEDAGYEVSLQYPAKYDPAVQIPMLNAVVNTKPAGILISPDDPHALVPLIKQATGQGIHVVTVDTGVENPEAAGVASAVATNDVAAGKGAAELIGKATNGRKGDVALVTFSPGAAQVADDRMNGFEEEIKNYPNLHYVGRTVADDVTAAAAKTNALLASHPNLIAILGTYTGASEGMLQALKQRGMSKKVVAVANDGDASLIDAIRAGDLHGSVFPKILENGNVAGQQLLAALTGKETTPIVKSMPLAVTKDNLDDPAVSKYFTKENAGC